MAFDYKYTVQFRDTDAAGVGFFASILAICHGAYEASLMAADIDLKSFVNNTEFAVPILHVSADFFKPLYCGDRINIQLIPTQIDKFKFEIKYTITSEDRQLLFTTAITKHIAIDPQLRKRCELPPSLIYWLDCWGKFSSK